MFLLLLRMNNDVHFKSPTFRQVVKTPAFNSLVLILLAIWIVRILHIRFGLPYLYISGESRIFDHGYKMLYGMDPFPHYHMYGSILQYLSALTILALGTISKFFIFLGLGTETTQNIAKQFLSTPSIGLPLKTDFAYYSLYFSRFVFVSLHTVAGYFIYRIIIRCSGNAVFGLLGVLANASLLLQFQFSMTLRMEVVSIFFITGLAWACLVHWEEGTKKSAIFLGLFSALTVNAEYSMAPVLLVPFSVAILKNISTCNLSDHSPWEKRFPFRPSILLLSSTFLAWMTLVILWSRTEIRFFEPIFSTSFRYRALLIWGTPVFFGIFLSKFFSNFFKQRWIPYSFLLGFVPLLSFLFVGAIARPIGFADQVISYLWDAYTVDFRGMRLSTLQMLRQGSYLVFTDQLGPVFAILLVLSPLAFINNFKRKDFRASNIIFYSIALILIYYLFFKIKILINRRYVTPSAIEIVLAMLSLHFFYETIKKHSKKLAIFFVAIVFSAGIFLNLNRIIPYSKMAFTEDTRSVALNWIEKQGDKINLVLIDKALHMETVDTLDRKLKVIFKDVDQSTKNLFSPEAPEYIITSDRKLHDLALDPLKKTPHGADPVTFFYQKSLFDITFLEGYEVVKTIRNPIKIDFDISTTGYTLYTLGGKSNYIVNHPDVIILKLKKKASK